MALPTRPLGKNGPQVVRIGLGLMGLSTAYGLPLPDEERLAFLDKAYEMGDTFWDTSDVYGDCEDLLGKWFAANPDKRDKIFLATKFAGPLAARAEPESSFESASAKINSSPEYCKKAIESSLRRLGLPSVDLYYVHRMDLVTPIEKTVRAMVELKKAGKIRHIGLSECSARTLRRAHAVHPIAAVQMEYSAFCLDIEQRDVLATARELGIAVVAYSPLGRGVLTGTIRSAADVGKPGDFRAALPWLSDENLAANVAVVDRINAVAEAKGVTPAQLALAWVLAQGDDIFVIPGTTKASRLAENLKAGEVRLTPEEDKSIRALAAGIKGDREPESWSAYSFADTPEEE